MKTKLSKWGNSLALRLPKQIAESQRLHEGASLEIEEQENGFLVRASSASYTLSELLEGVSKKNVHSESLVDDPVGEELW